MKQEVCEFKVSLSNLVRFESLYLYFGAQADLEVSIILTLKSSSSCFSL